MFSIEILMKHIGNYYLLDSIGVQYIGTINRNKCTQVQRNLASQFS